MTPLDKAREALAAVEKASGGIWEAGSGDLFAGGLLVGDTGAWCDTNDNAAAIVSAVNFVRADLPALIAEHERLADRVAKLEAGLAWYGEQAAGCRKLGSIGEPARHALDADGGKRARALLTPTKGAEDDA